MLYVSARPEGQAFKCVTASMYMEEIIYKCVAKSFQCLLNVQIKDQKVSEQI